MSRAFQGLTLSFWDLSSDLQGGKKSTSEIREQLISIAHTSEEILDRAKIFDDLLVVAVHNTALS